MWSLIFSQVISGRSPLCNRRGDEKAKKAFPVIDAAFSPEGTLYVAEERPGGAGAGGGQARLRAIDQNGAVRDIAGFAGKVRKS